MKIKVIKPFLDIHTKAPYKVGAVIEMDRERLEEAKKNLESSGGGFLEVIEEPEAVEDAAEVIEEPEAVEDAETVEKDKATGVAPKTNSRRRK